MAGAKSSAVLRNLAPGANSYVFLMHPDQALEYVRTDRRTAAVVMNHNMARDTALVRALLRSPVPYIGLLGPRTRCATAFARAGTDDGDSGRIFGPVGLDIGADTPQEIALSIVAEIQAALTRAGGGSLRSRPGAVHQNQAACAT